MQKFVDQPLTTHDNCGGAVERLISTSALQFKGTGWYITDYARAGNGADKTKTDKSTDSADSKKIETAKSEPAKSTAETAVSSAKPSSAKPSNDK